MKIKTVKFGEIEIDDNKVLNMPDGLPGFPGRKSFALLEDPKTVPFCWFQSLDDPHLALIVMSPFLFKPDYDVDLKGYIASRKGKDVQQDDLQVIVVINIHQGDKGKRVTANLMGPIIINNRTKEAVQMVMPDSPYSHQYDVMEHLKVNT